MRSFKTEGIIIKRRNFREADRILTVYTKNSGKIQIRASGVRRITSRRSPHIEPLNLSVLNLYQGRAIPILTEVETIEEFSEIKCDLNKVGFAYHICELIDGLCAENQENRTVFFLLKETLERLSTDEDILSIVHEFEIELLTTLGFYTPTEAAKDINTVSFIERILERKLKSRQLLSHLK